MVGTVCNMSAASGLHVIFCIEKLMQIDDRSNGGHWRDWKTGLNFRAGMARQSAQILRNPSTKAALIVKWLSV